jgi:ATP-binding cassette subfamily F protein 3
MLALLAALEANVLVLDEPTNHLDLWSRHALEQALTQFDGTVLLVTHDRYLVNAVADHLLVLRGGQASAITGNYDTYRHWLRQGMAIADRGGVACSSKAANTKSASPRDEPRIPKGDPAPGGNSKRKRKYPYRKPILIEQEIGHVENRIEEIHVQVVLPEVLRDGRLVKQLHEELVELESKLLQLYEHYEEACELN